MLFKQDAVIVEPRGTHRASIIWLHGLGADGHDFEPVVPQLDLEASAGVRFIFPNAPIMPVTINGGVAMRAWYDVRSANLREYEDEASTITSSSLIRRYIELEISNGTPADRIILAGFSQGGAIALHTGLRYDQTLAGIIVLSAYLPLPHKLDSETNNANEGIAIFMGHGVYDTVINIDHCRDSANILEVAGYNVDINEYMMKHAVCPEEIKDISMFINRQLA